MGRGDGVNERLLENENNRLSDQLAGKISKLKQISIEMKVRSFSNIRNYPPWYETQTILYNIRTLITV